MRLVARLERVSVDEGGAYEAVKNRFCSGLGGSGRRREERKGRGDEGETLKSDEPVDALYSYVHATHHQVEEKQLRAMSG